MAVYCNLLSDKSANHLIAVLIFLPILFTSSCAHHKAPASKCYSEAEIERCIREECMRLRAFYYTHDGNNHTGLDCSGLVSAVYMSLFNIELPRTAKEQAMQGIPVSRDNLRAGDLIFFKPPDYSYHVGILLSKDRFVHVSKLKGIIVSQIDPYYWAKYYWTGRRVLGPRPLSPAQK
jgi:cell wall-associated NlpC family hydrolase